MANFSQKLIEKETFYNFQAIWVLKSLADILTIIPIITFWEILSESLVKILKNN